MLWHGTAPVNVRVSKLPLLISAAPVVCFCEAYLLLGTIMSTFTAVHTVTEQEAGTFKLAPGSLVTTQAPASLLNKTVALTFQAYITTCGLPGTV